MIVLWNGDEDEDRDGDEDEVGDGDDEIGNRNGDDEIGNRNGDSVQWEGVGNRGGG